MEGVMGIGILLILRKAKQRRVSCRVPDFLRRGGLLFLHLALILRRAR
jgi:hypothetical protein